MIWENYGCDGGIPDVAFRYIALNGGLDTEKSYPYIDHETDANTYRCHYNPGMCTHRCHYNPKNVGATVKGWVDIPSGDEEALKAAVAIHGPIAVAIDATTLSFYEHGVYESQLCSIVTRLNHAVLVVGYGTELKYTLDKWTGEESVENIDYWIIKNSYGEKWGENGYFKLRRNFGNMCGVASLASYPLV